jgi:hypothetical protein
LGGSTTLYLGRRRAVAVAARLPRAKAVRWLLLIRLFYKAN